MLQVRRFADLSRKEIEELVDRPGGDLQGLYPQVRAVIEQVAAEGDTALIELTKQFDRVEVDSIEVTPAEWQQAVMAVDGSDLAQAISSAASNVRSFHQAQMPEPISVETCEGVRCWRRWSPVEKVGFYIPGGRAPLISTVLMLAVPAQVAGNPIRVVCTPPRKDGTIHPAILFAAKLTGVQKVFKVGGAQAVAAMALGSKSVTKVDKIFGPGNRWVTAAKALVSLPPYSTGIDMLAGPSELMILVGSEVDTRWIAADLISQAEHGPDSQVVLVARDSEVLMRIRSDIETQLESVGDTEREVLMQSLKNSFCLQVDSWEEALKFSEVYGPEHLQLAGAGPQELASRITNSGSVFVGPYSSVVLGDYASGTNHTLPTGATARYSGGLCVESYLKPLLFQEVTPQGFSKVASTVELLARAEGLLGHAEAVSVRKERK